MNKIKLSIIIPAYNEKSRIAETLEDVFSYLKTINYCAEILVVDDGSSDDTCKEVAKYSEKNKNLRTVIYKKNMGKGYAVKKGMAASSGEYVLFMDADNSTRIKEIEKLWPWVNKDYKIVIGSRNIKDENSKVNRTYFRKIVGVISNLMIKILLGLKYTDTQCGFKLFEARTGKALFELQRIYRWGFDFEILAIAKKKNFQVKEVPVNWQEKSNSKVNPITDIIKTFWDLLKVAANIRSNKY